MKRSRRFRTSNGRGLTRKIPRDMFRKGKSRSSSCFCRISKEDMEERRRRRRSTGRSRSGGVAARVTITKRKKKKKKRKRKRKKKKKKKKKCAKLTRKTRDERSFRLQPTHNNPLPEDESPCRPSLKIR